MGVSSIIGYFRLIFYRLFHFLHGGKITIHHILMEMFTKFNKFDIETYPNRPGDVAVITGGEVGIGYHVIKKLLQKNFRVLMGIRDLELGREAVETIRKTGVTTGEVEFLLLDLGSLESVRQFAQAVLSKTDKIHLLFNNAGIMAVPYRVTVDNMESQFQVNYLSHFLLTNLLLPCIVRTGITSAKNCRIVHTASASHYGGSINFKDLQHSNMYSSKKAYCDSKLAIVLGTKYLDHKLVSENAKVRVYSLHPGCIPTGLWDALECFVQVLGNLSARLLPLLTPDQAAQSVLYAALSPDLENRGGLYLTNSRDRKCNPLVYDVNLQENLWNVSLRLVGLSNSEDVSSKERYTVLHELYCT